MLTSLSARGDRPAAIDSIHNYYERMVLDEIQRQSHRPGDSEFFADVACVALNHLPPRYIRYDVDMAFYLSPKERMETEEKVGAAVRSALHFVRRRVQRET